jgi:hypothetical protein
MYVVIAYLVACLKHVINNRVACALSHILYIYICIVDFTVLEHSNVEKKEAVRLCDNNV